MIEKMVAALSECAPLRNTSSSCNLRRVSLRMLQSVKPEKGLARGFAA